MPAPLSRPAAALLGVTLLVAGSGCTGDDKSPRASSSSSPPEAAAAPSVPMKVVVTRVSGKLPKKSRSALEANVGKTVTAYVDAAFLKGEYPRADFSDSFGAFTPGAARQARHDLPLLTNKGLGPTTESVRATRRTAYLSVLAPHKVAAGVTAKVNLVFVVNRVDQPAQRIRLGGRLLLTRNKGAGAWSIFGYDLHRSDTPRSGS